MSFRKKGRKFRTESGKTFPKSSDKMGKLKSENLTDVIATCLRDSFGDDPAAAKSLMRITGAGERTVKNWLQGKNAPSGENLIALIQQSDDVLDTVLLLSDRHEILAMKKMVDARDELLRIVELIDELMRFDTED